MIADGPHRSGRQKDAHVQGWLVSVLLHGTVALAAFLLVKQIQLAPQDKPFKWNIAMVSPTQLAQPTASPRTRLRPHQFRRRPRFPLPTCSRLRRHRRARRPGHLRN